LAKHTGSSGFTKEEILHIMNHPIMTDGNPSGEKLLIPEVPEIIKMYEKYFAKHSTQASSNFYLKSCNINEKRISEKKLKLFMKQIATNTGINLDDRKISNHSGRKTLVQILKRLNFSNTECMVSSRHKSE
ncbi:3230_t:CDS:2, partial [Funneliformis geosporum]